MPWAPPSPPQPAPRADWTATLIAAVLGFVAGCLGLTVIAVMYATGIARNYLLAGVAALAIFGVIELSKRSRRR